MTDEEMLAEAKQVGAITAAWIVHFSMDELREFARRIAEIEREECAQLASKIGRDMAQKCFSAQPNMWPDTIGAAIDKAIRASGEK